MTSVVCTWSLTKDGTYTLTAEISNPGMMPTDIFLYRNSGTTTMGEYQGVIGIRDLSKVPVWKGVAIDPFGAPFVRTSMVKIEGIAVSADISEIANRVGASVQVFSDSLKSLSTGTKSIEIK